jgi:hypothetical protein
MSNPLQGWLNRLLGRGSAAITVPIMDGALKPNRALDEATVVLNLPGIDDIASGGQQLLISAGPVLYVLENGVARELRRFEAPITALAVDAHGRIAVALDGRELRVLDAAGATLAQTQTLGGRNLRSANALAFEGDDSLLVSDGSEQFGPEQWCHDLMQHGKTGKVGRWSWQSGASTLLAQNTSYAFGVLASKGLARWSESWKHTLGSVRGSGAALSATVAELPGYPSRMAQAQGGGFWLTCFVCRTQLVEFVLREDAYRKRMVQEIHPSQWVAPALSSGKSFLEPLQGAGVKTMGVLKPWAPPRSYGLVLRVADDGRVLSSLHSQVDGQHHGITAVAEHAGALYLVSKGSARLLRVELNAAGDAA